MHLVNMPTIRVKEYPQGWVVERQMKKWYGKKYWVHIESVYGNPNQPWYFSKNEYALESVKTHIVWDIISSSSAL